MIWNYRIIRHKDGYLALHEVYYEIGDGRAWSRTEDPIRFISDAEEGPEGIIEALEMALKDAREHPVLDDLD